MYTRRINRWLLTVLLVLGIAALPSSVVEAQAAMDDAGWGAGAAPQGAPSHPQAALRAGGESKQMPFDREAPQRSHLSEDEAPEDIDDAEEVDGWPSAEAPERIGRLEAAWPLKAHDLALLRPPHT